MSDGGSKELSVVPGPQDGATELVDWSADNANDNDGPRMRRQRGGHQQHAAPSINVTVVTNKDGAGSKAKKAQREKRREQGDAFATCLHCKDPILYHEQPEKAVRPYQVCSNRCPGEYPKALHVTCVPAFCSLPGNDNEQLTAKCDACDNSFDLDQIKSVKILLATFLTSRFLKVSLILLVVFMLSGFGWKTWNYICVAKGMEPVDLINNPALLAYDHATNQSVVVRPTWSWSNWTGWASYNHCVITDWGKRRLLSDFDRHRRTISGGYKLPDTRELSMAEAYTKLYSFMLDTSDETFVDMSHYFSPCSDTGTIGFSWRWLFSHVAISIHALRWYLVGAAAFGFFVSIDAAIGWKFYKLLMKKSVTFRISQGGQSYVVRKTTTVAGVRRRIV